MLTGQKEGKSDRDRITYLMKMIKWVAKQSLREITERNHFIKSYNRMDVVECHDCLHRKGTVDIKNNVFSNALCIIGVLPPDRN